MRLILYQTLEDRGNPEEIENNGPFYCDRTDAWLTFGYYFWDTYIELGHWWGTHAYGEGNYIICKANGVKDEYCWDLHGDGMHRQEFEAVCNEMIEKGLTTKEKLMVPQVILYLIRTKSMVYSSIRALGMNSYSQRIFDPLLKYRIIFKKNTVSYLDLRPAVQVCLLEKRALSLSNYRIVYPPLYVEEEYI